MDEMQGMSFGTVSVAPSENEDGRTAVPESFPITPAAPPLDCPSCALKLRISWDMWGQFYVCDSCGFTAEDDDEVVEATASRQSPQVTVPVRATGCARMGPEVDMRPSQGLATLTSAYGIVLWMLWQRVRRVQFWQGRRI